MDTPLQKGCSAGTGTCVHKESHMPHKSLIDLGQVHNRLLWAFWGSPELILVTTLLLGSVGTCPRSSSRPIWPRPVGGSGGWAPRWAHTSKQLHRPAGA